MKDYRYPGAQPFSTDQQHLFFGREEDTARLYRLIKTQPLVLLYAKSGMGKSSLLNAGIIPSVLRDAEYTPLTIRFNAWTEGKKDMPDAIARQAVSPSGSKSTFLDSLIENESSLWHEIKENQILSGGQSKFLLLFDQFEELFTYPQSAIEAFKEQLAEVFYTRVPQRYREVLERQLQEGSCTLRNEEFDCLQEPPQLRIVLSIRSDRMHLMDRLSDRLPDVLSHCYELQALELAGAREALVRPAAQKGNFLSPPFAYTPAAVHKILGFLDDSEERIETLQLQILCRTFEERVREEGIREFHPDNLGDLEEIITHFYQRQLETLGDAEAQRPARLLIEEGLIMAEDQQRLTLHEAQISSLFAVPPAHLARLVSGGLLRAEPALRGGYAYELSHDTLVRPALVARNARRKEEERIALAAERRKRVRSRNLNFILAGLTLLSLSGTSVAVVQSQRALSAQTEAVQQRDTAEQQKKVALVEFERANASEQRANQARQAALELASKGQRLQFTIADDANTYTFLLQKGHSFLQEGDFRDALTHLATARFLNENPEIIRLVDLARQGVEAGRLFQEGYLPEAKKIYREIAGAAPECTAICQQQIEAAEHAEAVFKEALAGQPWQTVTRLDLSHQDLATLPRQISALVRLQQLYLGSNQLVRLPAAVWQLKELRTLDLQLNPLGELPQELGQLGRLEKLSLYSSSMVDLPEAIGNLKALRELDLRGSASLKHLPQSLGRLSALTTLMLAKSPLKALPRELSGLKNLRFLSLTDMPGLDLGPVWKLSRLDTLMLANNGLRELPSGIGALTSLHLLDLHFNELRRLPGEIARLRQLQRLDLQNNPLDEAARKSLREQLPACSIEF